MIVKVARESVIDGAIPSKIYLDGAFYCYGLESDLYKVPAGKYPAYRAYSEKYGKDKLYINVLNRSGIMFHGGNRSAESKGCILTGRNRDGSTISGDCSDDLLTRVNDAYNAGEGVIVDITDTSKKMAYALITAGVLALLYFAVKG